MKYSIGDRYSKLQIVGTSDRRDHVTVKCDCGTIKSVRFYNLKKGASKSCGCTNFGRSYVRHYLNTQENRRTYEAWINMKERCRNPKHRCWKDYGGRGIRVCDEWQNSFPNFLSDMGLCPAGFSIERIEVNGNYEKSNCKWIPLSHQGRNKRANVFLNLNGKRMIMELACSEIQINSGNITSRRRRKNCTHQEAFDYYRKQKGF